MPDTPVAQTTFDFISAKPFRESLESDYAEMQRCQQASAWKSVQVLSGSIVESLLVDYLVVTSNPARAAKDPLKLDLAQAIVVCRDESVITARTADLCSVIRSYRNLIHPGRMVRLKEPSPGPKSAAIAVALVDMIAEEVATVRRAAVGLTAEQILSKIRRDRGTLTILKHLLSEASESERERLLIDLIPNAYFQILEGEEDCGDYLQRLQRAYPVVLESATDETRSRVAAEFVRIIREADGHRVEKYGEVFFRPTHMQYVTAQHLPIVREHLLGRVSNLHTKESLRLIDGIEEYLTTSDVGKWLDPLVRTALSQLLSTSLKEQARNHLVLAAAALTPEIDAAIDARLDMFATRYSTTKMPSQAAKVAELKKEIGDMRAAF